MRKLLVSTLVLSAVASTALAVVSGQFVLAEKTTEPSLWVKLYRNLFNKKEPPVEPRNGGSRPPNSVCMVSPDAPRVYRMVWSDRPLFIWQGYASTVAVQPIRSNANLWIQSVNQTQNITYTGEPLEPGQTYQWAVNSNQFVPFQIMEKPQRDRISTDLHNIEKQLNAMSANTEAIALAKANYFMENNLWSDVLQQIYSVPKPSAELIAFRQDIVQKLCNPAIANPS
ncbi:MULTISPECIES: hypothetical protein [unclassified Nodularia (in: cyanobacteria)]|uniref:hypothetical protein n=1 Tax=unclassified Nodularia (in: cyanobacteria) TaxID=2656917 RepID=UPI00187EDC3B|nr:MULTISPECIES: hypothetical protein [unclassified Nodularia (in: cyanobacteria)]MBE9198879.1 hypothetical protein [Nodularia sp. LEGE 06071]MCC2692657.1 hypothetical protein [Nodularia sp. LEGE 04288]